MSPKAEVFIPKGKESDLRAFVDGLSGKTYGIKEDERWGPHDLDSGKLTGFIKITEPFLVIPRKSYKSVFASLRFLPPKRQEEILVGFFTERVIDLPNAERFARFLTELNNLPPFIPNNEIGESDLQGFVDQYCTSLGKKSLPVRIRSSREPRTTLFDIRTDDMRRMIEELPFPIMKMVEAALKKPDVTDKNLMRRPNSIITEIAEIMTSSLIESPHQPQLDSEEKNRADLFRAGQPLIDIYRAGACPVGETTISFIVLVPQPIQKWM